MKDELFTLLAVLALCAGTLFGMWYLLAWAVVSVAWGFGASLPFWPTFAAVALGLTVLSVVSSGSSK